MLRWLVALLLIANLVFWAWTQGWMDNLVGMRARGDREPERLAHQVRPETMRIVTPQAVADAASAAASRSVCLEAGPFDNAGIAAAESVLSSLVPGDAWVRRTSEQPARWILYLGPYPSRESLQRKERELAQINVDYEEVSNVPELQGGLSLGRFSDRNAAEAARSRLPPAAAADAKVVALNKALTLHMLRVAHAAPDLAARLTALRVDALGKGFGACAGAS